MRSFGKSSNQSPMVSLTRSVQDDWYIDRQKNKLSVFKEFVKVNEKIHLHSVKKIMKNLTL